MKIVIVEDDVFFRKFYSTKLSDEGFSVITAADGEEGIEVIQREVPNLILLDLIMPKKDGFEVLKTIKQMENLKNIPVLIFSTLGQESDIQYALSLGAAGHVNKTFFDFENLLSRIKGILKI